MPLDPPHVSHGGPSLSSMGLVLGIVLGGLALLCVIAGKPYAATNTLHTLSKDAADKIVGRSHRHTGVLQAAEAAGQPRQAAADESRQQDKRRPVAAAQGAGVRLPRH